MRSYASNIPKLKDVNSALPTLIFGNLTSEAFCFKYEDSDSKNKKILDCKLDLSGLMLSIGGPASDLASLFYTSTENELRFGLHLTTRLVYSTCTVYNS